jgi:hypothetical protein
MAYRSPLTSLGEGIGQGLRDLAQTLIGAKQREQEIEEQRLRDELQRAHAAEQAELGRQFQAQQADVTAGRNLGLSFLEQALQAKAGLAGLEAMGEEVDPEVRAGLRDIIGNLQGAISAPFAEAGGIPAMIQDFGAPVAAATGQVGAQQQMLQQRQARQNQNYQEFQAATGGLLDPNLDLGTAQGMASFLANAARVRALASADMPPNTDTAAMVGYVNRMEDMIAADPTLARLRDNQLAASDQARVLTGLRIAEGQINNALLSMNVTLRGLDIQQAQQALEDMPAMRAEEAYAFFERTGLVLPGREELVRSMYDVSVAGTPGAPDFDTFQGQRFKAYTERLEADRDLLQMKVKVGRNEVTLSDYDVSRAEYEAQYRDLDRFIAMQGNALDMIGAALANGDVPNIMRMMHALQSPDADPRLHRYLTEAGITLPFLQSKLEEVKRTDAFQRRSLEYAMHELDNKFELADIALRQAQREDLAAPMVIASQLQSTMSASMSPDQIAAYYEQLSPEQQALMGGATGLAAAQGRSRLRERLEAMDVTQGAMDFLRFLQTAHIPEDQIADTAQAVLRHLSDNDVDPVTALAIANGFAGNWHIGNKEEARAQAAHEAQIALWNAQTAKLGIVDVPGTMGMDVGDIRQLLDSERQALGERRQNLNTQSLSMGCRGDTGGLSGLIQPPPNALPTTFNPTRFTDAEFQALSPGQQACVGIIRALNTVDNQLIELAGQYRNLMGFGALLSTTPFPEGGVAVPDGGPVYGGPAASYAQPGTGGTHPLSGWDISMFTGENLDILMYNFDEFARAGQLNPNDPDEVAEFLQWIAGELDVFGTRGTQPPAAPQGEAPPRSTFGINPDTARGVASTLMPWAYAKPEQDEGEREPSAVGQALGEFGAGALTTAAGAQLGQDSGTGVGGALTRFINWGLRNLPTMPGRR